MRALLARFNIKGPDTYHSGIFLTAIFLLSLTLRLVYIGQSAKIPLFAFLSTDSTYYDSFAMEILNGNFLFKESVFMNPVYPLFLSVVYKVFGHSTHAVIYLQAVIDSLSCIMLYFLCLRINLKRSIAFTASIIYACYNMSVFYSGFLLDTTLVVFFYILSLLIFFHAFYGKKRALWVFAGISIGFAMSLKGYILFALILFFTWYFFLFKKEAKNKVVHLMLTLAGVFFVVMPLSVRHYAIDNRFSPFPAHGGYNFYIGSRRGPMEFDAAQTGRPNEPIEEVKYSILLARRETGKPLTAGGGSRYWFLKGLEFIRDHPGRYARLLMRKIMFFWNKYEIPSNVDFYFTRQRIPLLKLPLFSFGLIAPLALSGIFLGIIRKDKRLSLISSFICICMVTVVLHIVNARFRMVSVPFLVVMASFAIHQLRSFVKDLNAKNIIISAVVLLVLFLLVNTSAMIPRTFPHAVSHNNLGNLYFRKNMFDEAYSCYRKAIESNPYYAEALSNIGNVFFKKGMFEEAVGAYQDALDKDPLYDKARYNLGRAYARKGMIEEAIVEYKKTIKVNPLFVSSYNNLGRLYLKKKMFKRAINEFKKALELEPRHENAHLNLAAAYLDSDLRDDAINEYKKMIKINPRSLRAYSFLSDLYLRRAEFEKALSVYKKAVKINPGSKEAHYNFGNLYFSGQLLEEAVKEYRRAIRIDPDYEKAHNNLANAFAGQGRIDLAIQHYNYALKINPANGAVHHNVALCYLEKERYDLVRFHSRRAVENGFTNVSDKLKKYL